MERTLAERRAAAKRWAQPYFFIMLVIVCILVGQPVMAAGGESGTAGVIDATGFDFSQNEMVSLDGEWEFFWNRLLAPIDFRQSVVTPPTYERVPSQWNAYQSGGHPLSNQGYATYRVRIQIKDSDRNRQLALYMPSVATSYILWINGKELARNGVVALQADDMKPMNYPKVVTFQSEKTTVELVIQVANFVQRKGGLWQSIKLGSAESVLYQRDKHVAYEMVITGSLFIMAIYHFMIFLLQRREWAAFYFGVLCLMIGMRNLLLGETLAIRFFPGLTWDLAVRGEYISVMISLICLILFVHAQYPRETNRHVRIVAIWMCAGVLVATLLTKPLLFTQLHIFIQLLTVGSLCMIFCAYVLAAIRKRSGSVLNGIGLAFFIVSILDDFFYYFLNQTWLPENMIPLGLLLFMVTQMMNFSVKFARLFRNVADLSMELKSANELLEQKVKQRTEALELANLDLEKANAELSQMEESRRRLLSNISHELGTPLTSIQGYVKGMIDGIVPSGDQKYLKLIHDKTLLLGRIIRDLFELTKLEARQIQFDFREVEIHALLDTLCAKYELDVEKHGLRLIRELPAQHVTAHQTVVNVDPMRFEQVFANLLVNAQKFTPADGIIRVELRVETESASAGVAVVTVSDTGSGIAKEELPFLFDRFFKAAESRKTKSDGVGLGLAIVKEIIQYHQGQISVDSAPGEGTSFIIRLPVRFIPERERQEVS
ncbi:ATP-binding protein [Brevibacillus fluminis]|uniref:ATP-binding protein n=1 Tax=Brevibacillus fluminis TaxID=511487 RepID=UPI001606E4C8|nr:ATP-binding protein [Brevibacillus fluminis]